MASSDDSMEKPVIRLGKLVTNMNDDEDFMISARPRSGIAYLEVHLSRRWRRRPGSWNSRVETEFARGQAEAACPAHDAEAMALPMPAAGGLPLPGWPP